MTTIQDIIQARRNKPKEILIIKPWRRDSQSSAMWRAQHWAILQGETHLLEIPIREIQLAAILLDELWDLAKGWTMYVETGNRAICSGMGVTMLGNSLGRELRYSDKMLFSEKKHFEKLADALQAQVSSHERLAALGRLSKGYLLPITPNNLQEMSCPAASSLTSRKIA